MRSTRRTAAWAVIYGLSTLFLAGCLFGEQDGSTSNAHTMGDPDLDGELPPDEGDPDLDGGMAPDEGGPECWADFEDCVRTIAESGGDPGICEPILEGCEESDSHDGPGEGACYEEYEACLCDPMSGEVPGLCDDQLDACLAELDPCMDTIDSCAADFEVCFADGGDPEACEPLLEACEEPPAPDCMEEYGLCVEDPGADPESCEELLVYCFEPPPEVPEWDCLDDFEECLRWADGADDPEVCDMILDACHDGSSDDLAPEDWMCANEYEHCVEEHLDRMEDPAVCEPVLDECVGEPEFEDPGMGEPDGEMGGPSGDLSCLSVHRTCVHEHLDRGEDPTVCDALLYECAGDPGFGDPGME